MGFGWHPIYEMENNPFMFETTKQSWFPPDFPHDFPFPHGFLNGYDLDLQKVGMIWNKI